MQHCVRGREPFLVVKVCDLGLKRASFFSFPLLYDRRTLLFFHIAAGNKKHFTSFVLSSEGEGTARTRRGKASLSPVCYLTWLVNGVVGEEDYV